MSQERFVMNGFLVTIVGNVYNGWHNADAVIEAMVVRYERILRRSDPQLRVGE